MKKSIQFYIIILLIILTFFLFGMGNKDLMEMKSEKSTNLLKTFSIWFITNGLSHYYNNQNFSIIIDQAKKKDIFFYHQGLITDKKGFICQIVIQRMWVVAHVTCYERKAYLDKTYEYWAIQFESKRKDFECLIDFYIAKTKGLNQEREIVYETNKFLEYFSIGDNSIIEFPMQRMESIYELRPWNFPEAFKGTNLEQIRESKIIKEMNP